MQQMWVNGQTRHPNLAGLFVRSGRSLLDRYPTRRTNAQDEPCRLHSLRAIMTLARICNCTIKRALPTKPLCGDKPDDFEE